MTDVTHVQSLTMSDVARLADVQRPVVSVWRSRSAATDSPFPPPVEPSSRQLRFDAAAVVDWLERTGRGNSETVRADLATFSVVEGASPRAELAVFDATTALLCLKAMTGRSLSGVEPDEIMDLADEIDPDDEFIFREIAASADRLAVLAPHVDDMASAAFHAAAAFETLLADRFRSGPAELASTAVDDQALALTARIASAVGSASDGGRDFSDPTGGSGDLLLAATRADVDAAPEVFLGGGDEPLVRLVRRRLGAHGVSQHRVGSDTTQRSGTLLVQLPNGAQPDQSDSDLLAVVEQVTQSLAATRFGVVLAPARALCDGFSDATADGIRSDLLRSGHIRAIVRLPRGLAATQGRQALAIWVVGSADHRTAAEDHRTLVADLINTPLASDIVDSLVDDLVAAIRPAEGERTSPGSRAYRLLRAVSTRQLLTARRSLVETSGAAHQTASPRPGRLGQTQEALARLVGPSADLTELRFVPSAGHHVQAEVALGALIQAQHVRVLSGLRVQAADRGTPSSGRTTGVAGVRLTKVEDLIGLSRRDEAWMDWVTLISRYPSAQRTEAGDVVFCTSPRPAALVDRVGGAVVCFPARVLRIDHHDPGGLVPDILAADISKLPAAARQWRRWPVRRIPPASRAAVLDAFARVARAREETQRQLREIDDLAELMADGLTDGSMIPVLDKPAPVSETVRGL